MTRINLDFTWENSAQKTITVYDQLLMNGVSVS
ncbi:hypothetical protein J2W55_002791 [Mucilaginibacter pocheonensis]|uniref:Uncharacterized protein n=1 Tax=Mucilaginibacter pocheonensis TaxID=398050 RepID=A0ABU1TC69_9SPHI|nr:hypothetical protein [Mucilaginibacter pocheonensis]